MIGMIINRMKDQLSILREYSLQEDLYLFSTTIDYLLCRIFYGYCIDDYTCNSSGRFTSNVFRNRFFSFKRWQFVLKRLNDTKDVSILDDKVIFLKFFKKYIKHDWIYPKEATIEQFNNFINSHHQIISKPTKSIYGLGVTIFSTSNAISSYTALCSKDILLEEQIKQHPSLSIGGKSVNTIRVYSILDRNNKVHILKSILRVGTGNSIVDNFHSGGVIYPINLQYGIIEAYGVQKNSNKRIFYHPGTEQCMIGYKIPSWGKILTLVRDAHIMLKNVRYIGWDIVVLENGDVDIIEANSNADHALFSRVGYDKLFYDKIKALL